MTNENVLPSRSGTLPEVPWVMGDPHASYKWQVSVAGKGKKKGKGGRTKPEKLENIKLKLTLKVKKSYSGGNFFNRIFGGSVKEDFNSIIVAETLLRALHHAKFKSIVKISADGETLYQSNNKDEDIKEIIQILKDEEFEGTLFKRVNILAEHRTSLPVKIEIRRVHSRRKVPIIIILNGKIKKENLERLMSYIKKHLPIEELHY